jgi:hypothetical protein
MPSEFNQVDWPFFKVWSNDWFISFAPSCSQSTGSTFDSHRLAVRKFWNMGRVSGTKAYQCLLCYNSVNFLWEMPVIESLGNYWSARRLLQLLMAVHGSPLAALLSLRNTLILTRNGVRRESKRRISLLVSRSLLMFVTCATSLVCCVIQSDIGDRMVRPSSSGCTYRIPVSSV